ncbi:MAG: hypothetical protein L3K18_01985 [Thermoplasmata archaeon]|nr:hypothetical protein [Thermoplasmata archaeon]
MTLPPIRGRRDRRRARWAALALVVVLFALSVALLALVPVEHSSRAVVLEATNGWTASAEFRVVLPTEVVVHVASSDPLGVSYRVQGPGVGGGAQSALATPTGTTTTFWTWGGSYSVEFTQPIETCPVDACPHVPFTAWANATSGIL